MEGPRSKVAFLAPLCISIINLIIISYHFIYKDSDGLMDAVMKAEDQVRVLRVQLQNSEKSFNIEKEKTEYLSRLVDSLNQDSTNHSGRIPMTFFIPENPDLIR